MLYTTLRRSGRDQVMAELRRSGIEARLYFPPAHQQPIFRRRAVSLPVTERLASQMLSIPFQSLLTEAELKRFAWPYSRAMTAAGSLEAAQQADRKYDRADRRRSQD
jgi:dTDP-4-amino-4,6-dideoxygalactose transaminase